MSAWTTIGQLAGECDAGRGWHELWRGLCAWKLCCLPWLLALAGCSHHACHMPATNRLLLCSNKFTKCRKEQKDFEEACPVS